MGDANSEMLELLECPVCYETSKPPITMCSNGHNICSVCKVQINKCPLCLGNLTTTRNWHAEKSYELLTSQSVITGLPKPVDNKNPLLKRNRLRVPTKGELGGSALFRSHSSAVGHGSSSNRITCDMKTSKLQCNHQTIPTFSLRRHWEIDHGLIQRVNGCLSNLTIKECRTATELNQNGYCEPWVLTISGKYFVVMRKFTVEGLYFWVNMNADKSEAEQFTAQIVLEDSVKKKIAVWSGHTQSAFERSDQENALFFSWNQLRRSALYDPSRQSWSLHQRVAVHPNFQNSRRPFPLGQQLLLPA